MPTEQQIYTLNVVKAERRLNLAKRLFQGNGWLDNDDKPTAIAVLSTRGRIRLLPWNPYGEQVSDKRELLLGSSEIEQTEALLDLTTRFRKVPMESNWRINLKDELFDHLDQREEDPIYVISIPGSVDLWARWYRMERLQQHHNDLADGLPW